jgi:cysteine desulfurase
MQIYLDYSATTPPRPEVITAMQEVLTQQWGNPSSLHEWGQRSGNSSGTGENAGGWAD